MEKTANAIDVISDVQFEEMRQSIHEKLDNFVGDDVLSMMQLKTDQEAAQAENREIFELKNRAVEEIHPCLLLFQADAGKKAGEIIPCLANLLKIFRYDRYFACDGMTFANVYWNTLSERPEFIRLDVAHNRHIYKPLTDVTDFHVRTHIELLYFRANAADIKSALDSYADSRRFNPVRETILLTRWDGVPRCADFLTVWAGAGNSPYVREVSRLLFATGIHRALNPGCDLHAVPVLTSGQGRGKTALCKLLSLGLYTSLRTDVSDDKRAAEAITGAFLVEVEELAALTKRKENSEAVKAFLTGVSSTFRGAYDKRTTEHPRTCFFIGTTNNAEFIEDPTGGRRFFPIEFNPEKHPLERETECRQYIAQCWAEALEKAEHPEIYGDEMSNVPSRELEQEFKHRQEQAAISDPWEGYIAGYLDRVENPTAYGETEQGLAYGTTKSGNLFVSCVNIYNWIRRVFEESSVPYNPYKDGRRIAQIMTKHANWKQSTCRIRICDREIVSKGWEKIE